MQLNTDLVEQAKLEARKKQDQTAMTASRIRSQQEEAQEIRQSDDMLFGDKPKNPTSNEPSTQMQQKQALINEFMISQSAMQCSVVDMQRDPSFVLATSHNEIIV